jgi:hypothetical protein
MRHMTSKVGRLSVVGLASLMAIATTANEVAAQVIGRVN